MRIIKENSDRCSRAIDDEETEEGSACIIVNGTIVVDSNVFKGDISIADFFVDNIFEGIEKAENHEVLVVLEDHIFHFYFHGTQNVKAFTLRCLFHWYRWIIYNS